MVEGGEDEVEKMEEGGGRGGGDEIIRERRWRRDSAVSTHPEPATHTTTCAPTKPV